MTFILCVPVIMSTKVKEWLTVGWCITDGSCCPWW